MNDIINRMTVEHVIRGVLAECFLKMRLGLPVSVVDHIASLIYTVLVNKGFEINRPPEKP